MRYVVNFMKVIQGAGRNYETVRPQVRPSAGAGDEFADTIRPIGGRFLADNAGTLRRLALDRLLLPVQHSLKVTGNRDNTDFQACFIEKSLFLIMALKTSLCPR